MAVTFIKPIPKRLLFVGFCVALALIGAVTWAGWRQFERVEAASILVFDTQELRTRLSRVLSLVQDIEAGSRGYVVTGDSSYLEPHEQARIRVDTELELLCAGAADTPQQKARCAEIATLVRQRLAVSRSVIELRRTAGFEAAQAAVAGGAGKVLMDQIRDLTDRMDGEEERLLVQRTADAKLTTQATTRRTTVAIGVSLMLLIGTFTLVIGESQRRQKSEAQLDRFFTLSLDMLAIADIGGSFRRVSPAFTRTLGHSTEELVSTPFLDFVHPEDRMATIAEMDRLRQGVPTISFENRYRCRDGSWRWLAWKVQPIKEEAVLYASARDVTDLRHSEEALRSSEARYRQLFASIDEGFCIIQMIFDEQQRPVDYLFLEINPAFEKHTGLHDALGKRMKHIAPEHESHWFDTYGRIAMTGEPARFVNRAEALRRWYDVYAFPFGEARQRQVAILFNDITDRLATEAEIAQLNADLQAHAASLAAANRELESFSYSVSHDLRAPLRSIDGFSQVVFEECGDQLNDSAQDALRRVRRAATTMGELIDALLALSRVTRAELREEQVDLSAIAVTIAAELQESHPAREVEFVIAPGLCVNGDRSLFRAMLLNLIENAWKYSASRPVARIEFGRFYRDGEAVYFVRDNGVGFDMNYVDRLFGAFQRLHKPSEYSGTGVGLATVQRILHRHRGRAWADGAVDSGATFYFTVGDSTGSPADLPTREATAS